MALFGAVFAAGQQKCALPVVSQTTTPEVTCKTHGHCAEKGEVPVASVKASGPAAKTRSKKTKRAEASEEFQQAAEKVAKIEVSTGSGPACSLDYGIVAPLSCAAMESKMAALSDEMDRSYNKALKTKARGVILDLFSGPNAPISEAAAAQSLVSMPFDITRGAEFDLLNSGVQRLIFRWIEDKKVKALHAGTPCATWSMARHGPRPGKVDAANEETEPKRRCTAPPPLRSRAGHIYGFSDLSVADMAKVSHGNKTMRITCEFIRAAMNAGACASLENPATSMLWGAPEVDSLCREAGGSHCCLTTCDLCAFGTPYRKRTRVAFWNCHPTSALSRKCSSKGGRCDYTQKDHIILTGWARHTFKTASASEYPAGFASEIVQSLMG